MNQIASVRNKNVRAEVLAGNPQYVYCGRKNNTYKLPKSPFDNPYRLKNRTTAEYIRVVDLFRTYWYADEQAALREQALQDLPGKTLVCWCAPKTCHCEVIAEFLENEGTGETE